MKYRFLRFPEGKMKAVTLSYDDGTVTDLRLAALCDQYGVKCTFNICSALLGNGDNRLTAEDLKARLLAKGHEVAIHGEHHIAPGITLPALMIADVLNCRRDLERELGVSVHPLEIDGSVFLDAVLEQAF